jgi:two-component system, LuxR family, sensor kinase FixL
MTQHTVLTKKQIRRFQDEISELIAGFDLLADHVVITDPNANIIYANRAVQKHTGYSIEEIMGKNPGDLWGGLMPKEFYEKMWEKIKRFKIPFVGEVENRNKDGDKYWQELRIYPILDDAGDVRFFIGMEPDITLRKAFEMHKDQYVEELERLNKFMEGREMKIEDLTRELAGLKQRFARMRKSANIISQ